MVVFIIGGFLIFCCHYIFLQLCSNHKAEDIKIRCGEWDISDDIDERYEYQEREVDVITKHPLYNRGPEKRLKLYHDVALVHTKEEFKIAPNVNPICLPDSKE